ncbi:MAG: tRNA pseudouridine(55) synthase TruB [Candidatus Marinimicrobia bacterium]|nr:tRNA pseudouridine(55) synthase TruB [Candidatus Neomarinimicrobiota bacterium]
MDHVQGFWKPTGLTSFDVIRKLKTYIKNVKIGHSGTLDPFAEGVLIICFGKATSQVERLMNLNKTYIGTIQLGETTDTLDTEGKITDSQPIPAISDELINSVLSEFTGDISQIPPMYSALKKNGVPLYKLARKGKIVPREPRKISIYKNRLISYSRDKITFEVECGRGTYIRTLASDISIKLGTVGYLIKLVRTKIGIFDETNSIRVENIPQWISTID